MGLYGSLTGALLAAGWIDFKTFRIPSFLNRFITVLGLIRLILDAEHCSDGIYGCIGMALFLGVVYALTKGQCIGGGDVKLMSAAGLMLGWQKSVLAFFAGALLALAVHSMQMLFAGAGRRLAFGPYLVCGIFISMQWGSKIISLYLAWPGIRFLS